MKPNIVELTNISKKYLLRHEKPTLVENIFCKHNTEEFWALKNVNLKIKAGENLGIIGRNGAGKTTLLEVIAGITTPSIGTVATAGKIISLIELEAGFHPDLTGEENIYLNGLILGMSKAEIQFKYNKIIKFAGIGKFINSPFYTYSDGMRLRLGFSIAIHSDPDILILDEGINMADENFWIKCRKKLEELSKNNKTILVAAHWLHIINSFCNRAIIMSKGKIIADEKSNKAINIYKKTYLQK